MQKGKDNKLDLYIGPFPALLNIFYLLQVLAPGMLVICYEYQSHDADVKVSRLLPQASWIESNVESKTRIAAILAAAKDRKIAFHEERTARPQNNSSLPGSDALPTAAEDQKIASDKKGKMRLKNNSQHSSLPGMDALPQAAAAKDQKTASHKKKRQPRSNTSSYTEPRYYITTGGDGYEWGMCDKDCGWCGRCILMER